MNCARPLNRFWLVFAALLAGGSFIAAVVVLLGQWYMLVHWSGGDFPPLVGDLAVIALGGVMLVGLVASAIGCLTALWQAWKAVRQRQYRAAAIATALAVVSALVFAFLNPS